MKFALSLPGLFLFVLLATQFIYIEFFGGFLRPYHFLVAVVVCLMAPGVGRLWGSATFRALVVLNSVSIVSALLSADPVAALVSYGLFALNSGIAVACAVLLSSGRLSRERLLSVVSRVTLLSVVLAVAQFAVFRGTGIPFGYSEEQVSQIVAGFAPSFFNEANAYAKFLVTPFFLFLPQLLRTEIGRRGLTLYSLMVLGFFLNFMRSAMVGIVAGLLFAMLWFYWTRSFSIFAKRVVALIAVFSVLLAWVLQSGVSFAEYNLYKIATVLDLDAVQSDESWQFRAAMMEIAVKETIADPFRIVFGNGWGQVYALVGGEMRQVGGADFINVFAYDGVLGVLAYGAMIALAIRAAMRRARRAADQDDRLLAEGVLFALIANTVVGLVSGVILSASFWLLIGLAISFERFAQRERAMLQTARPAW